MSTSGWAYQTCHREGEPWHKRRLIMNSLPVHADLPKYNSSGVMNSTDYPKSPLELLKHFCSLNRFSSVMYINFLNSLWLTHQEHLLSISYYFTHLCLIFHQVSNLSLQNSVFYGILKLSIPLAKFTENTKHGISWELLSLAKFGRGGKFSRNCSQFLVSMPRLSSAQPPVHTDKHISTRTKCCTLIGCCLSCPNIEHDLHGLFWATITWLVHFLISGTTRGSFSDWLPEWHHFMSFSNLLIFEVAPLSILFSDWLPEELILGPKIRIKIPSVRCLIPMLVTLVTSVFTGNS